MTTLRELIENDQFNIDLPLYVVDPQNEDDGAFPVQLEYDMTVTITRRGESPHECILLRVREDFDAVIVHD